MLGLAVGDGLGAPFEGVPADHIFWSHGRVVDLLDESAGDPLRVTDDTQMMVGVAETLVACGAIDAAELGRRFVAHYDPARGYGPGARRIIEAVAAGGDWGELAAAVFPGGSFGNGAAMRVAPVGLAFAPDPDRVAEQARLSALLTHHHPLGVEGAVVMASAVALALRGPPLDRGEFYRSLRRRCRTEEFRWQLRAARRLRRGDSLGFLGNSLPAHRSVVTAVACFTTNPNSFEDAVARAIELGDDTDTLAAMAGALSGAFLGVEAVPARWVARLEKGPHGADALCGLADGLAERFGPAHLPRMLNDDEM